MLFSMALFYHKFYIKQNAGLTREHQKPLFFVNLNVFECNFAYSN